MKRLIAISTLTLSLLATTTAFATGGSYCKVNNKYIELEANMTTGRAFGNPLVGPSWVKVRIKEGGLAVGITEYTFKKDAQVNELPFWFNVGPEMKLAGQVEPETDENGNPIDAYVALSFVIDTKLVPRKKDAAYDYIGTYTITQSSNSSGPGFLTKEFTGPIVCSGE